MRIKTSSQTNLQRRFRPGVYAVEMAAVISIFLMFFFGLIEYGRFLFIRSVMMNAAREGARFAAVNVYADTMVSDTQAQVKKYMSGVNTALSGYACDVYRADATGTKTGDATAASFGQYLCVEVSGKYSPILPTLLKLKSQYTLMNKAIMVSEAN